MLIADVASLEWEVLRWRRLKTSLIRLRGLAALEAFLREHLNDALYSDLVAERLTETLQKLAEMEDDLFRASDDVFQASDDVFQASDAQKLAHQYVRNEPNAVDRVENTVHPEALKWILKDARDRKAEDLVLRYVRHESDALTLVDKLLVRAGMTLDTLLANVLAKKLDDIERID